MERREFLRSLGAILAIAVCQSQSSFGISQNSRRGVSPKWGRKTRVFLAGVRRGASEEAMKLAVRAVAEATTDFSWLSKGDAVFIKPALNSGNPYPATTNPIAIGAMIELLKQKGARRVIIGDMSGIEHVKLSPKGLTGSSRRLMEASGMARAVQAAGGELHFFEDAGWNAFYEDAPAAGSHWKRGLMMPTILKEVEHIILMPRCGRHVLAGSTLGLKAAVGYWRTDTRLEYHRDATTFQEKTAEGNTVETLCKKQRLVVSAADKILTTFGPDEGHVFQPENGLVIASESVVAHDMVSLAWLLENRRNVPTSGMEWFKDNSPWAARIGNHYVVDKLGGWGPMLASEKLTKNDINAIWDDRVLNHAYQVFGGMPRVILDAANNALPEDLKKRLSEKTTRSA
ncbi:MAG: DUF362 domain-containing protein [Desulfobacterales bacterium]|nr:DUF362 domain-containing protein [Desulfobacterales bacterium]